MQSVHTKDETIHGSQVEFNFHQSQINGPKPEPIKTVNQSEHIDTLKKQFGNKKLSMKTKAILDKEELQVQKGFIIREEKNESKRKTCMFYPTEDQVKGAKVYVMDDIK